MWRSARLADDAVRMHDLKPPLHRACEIEALAWSTATGWSDAPLPGLPALLRWIAGAVFPPRQSEAGAMCAPSSGRGIRWFWRHVLNWSRRLSSASW